MTSLSLLTPASVTKVATLNLSAGTVTGSEVISKWFNTLPDLSGLNLYRPALRTLFDKYTHKILDFIQPALTSGGHGNALNVSDVSLVSRVSGCGLQGQELRVSEVHIVQSLCTLLEVGGCDSTTCTYT